MKSVALALVVCGCTSSASDSNDPTNNPQLPGDYTVHREMTGYEACPPYEEPLDFALSITSACATSPVDYATCEEITTAGGVLQFKLDEQWNAGAGVPSDYPRYVIATVDFMLHQDGDNLGGTAAGGYVYDTPTTGDDCRFNWNVTATRN
jgi:hypothetical protein